MFKMMNKVQNGLKIRKKMPDILYQMAFINISNLIKGINKCLFTSHIKDNIQTQTSNDKK